MLESNSSALLLIDLQQHFRAESPHCFDANFMRSIQDLREIANQLEIPVLHIFTRYNRNKSNWPRAWRDLNSIWCLEGSAGALPVPGAEPIGNEPVLFKTRYSGFYETELDAILRNLGVTTLLLAGYSTDVCVRFTTVDAYNLGYRLIIVKDCVRAMREDDATATEYLKWITDAHTLDAYELKATVRASLQK